MINVDIIKISSYNILTHLRLDTIAAILADNISKCIFLNENGRILTQILLIFIPKSPVDNKPTLVQVIAWRNKPLPEPMMTKFTDAYMHHWGWGWRGGGWGESYDNVDTCRNINT